jgi:ADP-ribose pyrophosphatase YjhB (NUDIX family)
VNAPPVVLKVANQVRGVVWRIVGPRTVGIRGLVVDEQGRVLLVHHTYGPDLWHLPGGGVKRRESLVAALYRELREEAGIIVTGHVRLLGAYSSLVEGKSDHIAVFVVEQYSRQESDSGEIAAAEFFAVDALPPGASPATRRRLDEWRANGPQTFDW